jgi:glyoxylase-like metal-dependent hydrolase (beta-lactamase superfamily II)
MNVHTDFKFHPKVTQIGCYWGGGGHTELYLLEGERLAIVDTGSLDTPERYIAPALEATGRSLADVQVIINTHGHHDHAGGNAPLVAASGAEVWMPERDVDIAESLDAQFQQYFANNDLLIGREDRLAHSRAEMETLAQPTKVDRVIKDGEVLELGRGVRLRAIPTPGHTRGAVSFFWEEEGILFTGDAVPGAGSRPGGMPLIYFPHQYEETLARLLALDARTLCLGHHYFSLTLSRESVKVGEAVRQYLVEAGEVARLIGDSVQRAMAARPAAPFLEVARAATEELAPRLNLRLNPETGLAATQPVASIHAYWQLYRA